MKRIRKINLCRSPYIIQEDTQEEITDSEYALQKYKLYASRVTSILAEKLGIHEENENPVDAAVKRTMTSIMQMDRSKDNKVNNKQIAMIVNAAGKNLDPKHHEAFKKGIMKELGDF